MWAAGFTGRSRELLGGGGEAWLAWVASPPPTLSLKAFIKTRFVKIKHMDSKFTSTSHSCEHRLLRGEACRWTWQG